MRRLQGNRRRGLRLALMRVAGRVFLGVALISVALGFLAFVSFETQLGLTARHEPASYWDIVNRDNPRKGVPTIRLKPRRRKTATGMRQDSPSLAPSDGQIQPAESVQALHIEDAGTTG